MQSLSVRLPKHPISQAARPSRLSGFASLCVVGLGAAGLLTAQTPRRTVWDGAYTEAQATRGAMTFGQSCAGCHSLGSTGRAPLAGDAFWKSFAQKSVADLLEFTSAYMPNGSPGSLNEAAYDDIVALILKSNGFPAGTTELGRATAVGVQIVQKDGRSELPAGALARVLGCLAKSGSDWVVNSATSPERAEGAGQSAADAARPLGNRTVQLKFVISRLDAMIGSRVAVNGILMGADGVDGINVTAINRVSEKCP